MAGKKEKGKRHSLICSEWHSRRRTRHNISTMNIDFEGTAKNVFQACAKVKKQELLISLPVSDVLLYMQEAIKTGMMIQRQISDAQKNREVPSDIQPTENPDRKLSTGQV